MHPFLLTKLTEASKSQKIDSKFSTKTKNKMFQNLNMPPPLYTMTLGRQAGSKRGGIGGMVEDVLEADLEDRG